MIVATVFTEIFYGFNFVYFILLAESTKISSIQKLYTHTNVCDTALEVWKFMAYKSSQTLEYEMFYAYENFCDLHSRAFRLLLNFMNFVNTAGRNAFVYTEFHSS